jgi:preprotein translocase subunit YajC
MNILALILQGDGGFSLIWTILPFVAIFAIFYFLVIMPQRKQQQELKDLISNLKMGDRVVTNGGLIGKIVEVREKSFFIRSADKSIIEIARSAVVGIDAEGTT